MKRIIATTTLAAVSLTNTIDAFSPLTPPAVSCRSSSRLHSTTTDDDKDRIKKAGGGITTLTPGDLCCYDPNENAKLAGSNTLAERLEKGASFALFSDAEVEETSPTPPAPTPPVPAAAPPTPQPEVGAKPDNFFSSANLRSLLNGDSFRGRGRTQH
eukprot:CAMPEP_0196133110 /NCGR_PEP_ID=MMETSP0910-20130528/2469_1 /TAXON_ID=49265 /ORGANISM="Thalassiosira rotula, Strain GSO102" /LENGTH=156 /DNA_ID=CAMNT_0041392797 /DNA_START=28 /DNA_END=498 /DNA_ORIENTATION=+